MNKPRRYLIATTAISLIMLSCASAQVAPKGMGNWPGIPRAIANMSALHEGWYYDWGTSAVGETPGIQFMPMIWGHANVNPKDLSAGIATSMVVELTEENEKQSACKVCPFGTTHG